MKVVTDKQYDAPYWAAHRGIPGASSASKVFTSTGKASEQQARLIEELIAQHFDPGYGVFEDYQSAAMLNGHLIEPEARRFYAFERGLDVQQVGFCLSDCGRFGISPDGLVGDEGGVEIKSPKASTQVKYLLADKVPAEYVPQVHWSLVVSGRAWWDFISYSPGLPKLLIRVEPDDYTERMREAMDVFHTKYQDALARIREMAEQKNESYEQEREDDAIARLFGSTRRTA